jgi:hypothetical protein
MPMVWIACKVLWVFFMEPIVIGICWVDGYLEGGSAIISKPVMGAKRNSGRMLPSVIGGPGTVKESLLLEHLRWRCPMSRLSKVLQDTFMLHNCPYRGTQQGGGAGFNEFDVANVQPAPKGCG